jgi:hypothetical protein
MLMQLVWPNLSGSAAGTIRRLPPPMFSKPEVDGL